MKTVNLTRRTSRVTAALIAATLAESALAGAAATPPKLHG